MGNFHHRSMFYCDSPGDPYGRPEKRGPGRGGTFYTDQLQYYQKGWEGNQGKEDPSSTVAGQAHSQGLSAYICHLGLATALADKDYGLHFTGRKATAHKDYFSKKPQSWLVECWLRASLLRIHSPNTPN